MNIVNFRIDERLIHAQFTTSWINEIKPDRILIIDDNILSDDIQREALKISCPKNILMTIVESDKAVSRFNDNFFKDEKLFVLCKGLKVVKRMEKLGFLPDSITVGNLTYYDEDATKLTPYISLSPNQKKDIMELSSLGVKFIAQLRPHQEPLDIMELLANNNSISDYQKLNSRIVDSWCHKGWKYGQPISHDEFVAAQKGNYEIYLTPTKPVPNEWLNNIKGKKVLGLASGGAQQMPVLSALGAKCTLLDYSSVQCENERKVAQREGYDIDIVQADMSKPLPFEDETFDLIFHPVSNLFIEEVEPLFKECYRVLKTNGIFLGGYDLSFNYIFDETEERIIFSLPFNPLKDKSIAKACIDNDWGITFSHTIAEQIGGQLKVGFKLIDIYDDTSGSGNLHDHNVATYIATKCQK